MKNILKLAKKFNRSRKFRLLVLAILVKVLISAIALAVLSFWASQAIEAQAAYGLNPSLKQVKVAGSPTVYYLDHKLGVKKAYQSAAAFLSYGNKWSDIKTISRRQLDKWPDLKLVKLAGSQDVYYLNGNKKSLVKSPAELKNLKLGNTKIATVNQTDFSSRGEIPLTSFAKGGEKIKAGGGPSDTLTVALDPASPAAGYLPLSSRHNLAAVFDFKAGSSAVELKTITFTVNGIFKTEGIDKIYLANEADYAIGDPTELNGRSAMFNLAGDSLTVAAGQTKKIKVYVDLKTYPDFINHWLQLVLRQPSDIKADAAASGSFPIGAGQYKFVDGAVFGRAKIEELALNAGNQVVIGQSQKLIGKFKISETSNRESMTVKKIILINLGNAGAADLANFRLKDSANNLLAQANGLEDGAVIFNLNNFPVAKGSDGAFLLSADITGGQDKTVNFNLRDFYAVGNVYGYGLPFSQIDNNETFSVTREQLKVLSVDLSPVRLAASQSGTVIGNFQIRNNNQRIYLQNLTLSYEKTAAAPALNDAVYLINRDSGEIYGSVSADKLSTGAGVSFNGLALDPRQQLNISLVANIPTSASGGDKYRVVVHKISYRNDGGMLLEDGLELNGNYLIVSKSSLFIYPNNNNADMNFIKGQKDVKIASFMLEAAAGDDINISQITLAKSGDTSGSALYENGFSNLRLYISGNRVGNVIVRPSAASDVFDNFNYYFAAGSRQELSLLADTEADLKASQVQLIVASLAAVSNKSGVVSAVSGLNVASRAALFGNSAAQITAVNGGSFAAGIKDNNAGRFSVTNTGDEDIILDSIIIVTGGGGFSNSLGFSDLSVVDGANSRLIGNVFRPVAGANQISLNGYVIPAGQTAQFNIRVSASSDAPTTGFDVYLTGLTARGKKSNLSVAIQGDPTEKIPVNSTSANISGNGNNGSGKQNNQVVLNWPVDSRKINYGFHDPAYPFRASGEHNGIDIDAAQGTAVKAAADGVVAALADNTTTAYDYITIDHGQGIKTTYGHLSAIKVQIGDSVKQGQIIALSGGQPGAIGAGSNTSGPHLHFEVSQNGADADPMGFLK